MENLKKKKHKVLFSDLEVGDVFYHNCFYFKKTEEVIKELGDSKKTVNAHNLYDKWFHAYFYSHVYVLPVFSMTDK